MKKYLKKCLEPFKSGKKFLFTFLIDFVYWSFMAGFFYLASFLLNRKAFLTTGGKTAEQLKQELLLSSAEEAAVFFAHIKSYFLSLFGIIFLYLVLGILLFALSRYLIWSYLNHQSLKKKTYFRWIVISLLFMAAFTALSMPFFIVKYAVVLTLQFFPNVLYLFSQLFNFAFFLLFFFIFFLFAQTFTHHQKIWLSLSHTFALIAQKFKPLALAYLFTFVLSLLISLILLIPLYFFPALQAYNLPASLVIFLLFLAWLRLYLIQIIQ